MDRLNKIERLKDELYATDYIAIKASEGCDVSEHGDWKIQRQNIRNEINRIENMTEEEYWIEYPEEETPNEDFFWEDYPEEES